MSQWAKNSCGAWAVAFFVVVAGGAGLHAGPTPEEYPGNDQAATESAKQALSGRNKFPWYDAVRDDLKRVDLKVQRDEKDNRDSQWETTSPQNSSTTPVGTSPFLEFLSEVVRISIYLLIAALVAALIIYLVKAYLKRESRDLAATGDDVEDERDGEISRVENLPFQVAIPRGDMLSEAERHYAAGDYNKAIIYLFSYELMRLDKVHVIRLTRGKTNRQYVREANADLRLAAILKNTMLAFEDAFFGHHILTRERFDECWYELGEFQRLTNPEVEVAV